MNIGAGRKILGADLSFSSMTKVLFFQHATSIGGSIKSSSLLINNLTKDRKCEFDLVFKKNTPKDIKAIFSVKRISNFEIHYVFSHTSASAISSFNLFGILIQMYRFLIETFRSFIFFKQECDHYNVIHFNSIVLLPSLLGAYLAKKNSVIHIREQPPDTSFGIRNKLVCFLLSKANKVVFIGYQSPEKWKYYHGNRVYIPNPILKDVNMLEVRNKSKTGDILFLGGVNPIKGPQQVFKIMGSINRSAAIANLIWVGGKYSRERNLFHLAIDMYEKYFFNIRSSSKCEEIIKDNSLERCITRLPLLKSVKHLLEDCMYMIIAHQKDHFSRPLIEAISEGMIPICSDKCTDAKFILGKLSKELIYEHDRPEQASRIFTSLHHDKDKRNIILHELNRLKLDDYLEQKHCANIASIYENI